MSVHAISIWLLPYKNSLMWSWVPEHKSLPSCEACSTKGYYMSWNIVKLSVVMWRWIGLLAQAQHWYWPASRWFVHQCTEEMLGVSPRWECRRKLEQKTIMKRSVKVDCTSRSKVRQRYHVEIWSNGNSRRATTYCKRWEPILYMSRYRRPKCRLWFRML